MSQTTEFPTGEWERDIQHISDWLMTRTLCQIDLAGLFEEFCAKLTQAGIPLLRANAAMRAIHPMFEATTYTYWRDRGVEPNEVPHGARELPGWQQSPVRPLIEERLDEVNHPINAETAGDYPLFEELHALGGTHFFGLVVPFDQAEGQTTRTDGVLLTWATDRAGGFTDKELKMFRRLGTRFAVAAKMTKREQTAYNIVTAYMGRDAGCRVLSGQIRLGDGEVIPCVIWYSDMRHSTSLCEQLSHTEFLDALNVYFAATAGAIMASGGEVLRFIGDAVLAIYPIGETAFTPEEACRLALSAAKDAEDRLDAANSERAAQGLPTLDFGLALHKGEVMYGNIGVPDRVEFSVTGPAANETARIEGLTKQLGERILVSDVFTRHLDLDWRALGSFDMAGVSRTQNVFAPPADVIDDQPAQPMRLGR